MKSISLISAIGTPLLEDDSLNVAGLESHLEDQWRGGMTGVLVGGTMGLLQLQSDEVYAQLVDHTVHHLSSRGEILVGAGDTSLVRTRERILMLNKYRIDGVVVLAPYFWKFDQSELITYFTQLADMSKNPLYLYDLPGLTHTKLEIETVLKLAKHPNVRGIKCSGGPSDTQKLREAAPSSLRIIFAEAKLVDVLIRQGVRDHLDGIFAIAPAWTSAICKAAEAGQWDTAALLQRRLSELLRVVLQHGVFQSMTALLNARGITGKFAPAPVAPITETAQKELFLAPVVQELLHIGKNQPGENVFPENFEQSTVADEKLLPIAKPA